MLDVSNEYQMCSLDDTDDANDSSCVNVKLHLYQMCKGMAWPTHWDGGLHQGRGYCIKGQWVITLGVT